MNKTERRRFEASMDARSELIAELMAKQCHEWATQRAKDATGLEERPSEPYAHSRDAEMADNWDAAYDSAWEGEMDALTHRARSLQL